MRAEKKKKETKRSEWCTIDHAAQLKEKKESTRFSIRMYMYAVYCTHIPVLQDNT